MRVDVPGPEDDACVDYVCVPVVGEEEGVSKEGKYQPDRQTDHNMFIEQRGPPPLVGMLCPACAVPWFIVDSGGGGGGEEVVIVFVKD